MNRQWATADQHKANVTLNYWPRYTDLILDWTVLLRLVERRINTANGCEVDCAARYRVR